MFEESFISLGVIYGGFYMDSVYKQEVKKYGKKDSIIAVCAVLFFVAGMEVYVAILSALQINWETVPTFLRELEWPIAKTAMTVLSVIIIISVTKQGLSSIGIHKENLWNAVRLGVMLSLIPIFWGVLPIVLYSGEFVGLGLFAVLLARTFLMAFAEDILFVGFLQTRLSGFFKSDKIALFVGAALFSFMHVPPWLRLGQLNFDNLSFFALAVVVWFIMHFLLVAIYRRYNSLIPVTILHVFVNLMQNPNDFWIFANGYAEYADSWAGTGVPVLIIAVSVWAFIRHRRAKKLL